jgi:hypothetical protein
MALQDKKATPKKRALRSTRGQRIKAALARFRKQFPKDDYRRRLNKEEEERILGFGPAGV